MNRKQLTTLLIIGVVMGALGLFIKSRQNAGWTSGSTGLMGKKLLEDFDLNAVAQIEITDSENTVSLKKTEELWTVPDRGGYPVDFKKLGDFLFKVSEIKVTQEPTIGPSQFGRLKLKKPSESDSTESSGTVLSFLDDSGKEIKSILLGKEQMQESAGAQFGGPASMPVGRYVMVSDRPEKALVISDPLSSVTGDLGQWLNKDFFKVAKLKSVTVNPAGEGPSWTIARATETGKFDLEGGVGEEEQVAASKLSGYSYLLSSPAFNDVLVVDADSNDLMSAPTVARLETFEGFTYAVKLGQPNDSDNYKLQIAVEASIQESREPVDGESEEDKAKKDKEFAEERDRLKEKLASEKKLEGWTYLVSKWTVEKLLSQRQDLIEPKSEESAEVETPAAFNANPEGGSSSFLQNLNLNLDPLAAPDAAETEALIQDALGISQSDSAPAVVVEEISEAVESTTVPEDVEPSAEATPEEAEQETETPKEIESEASAESDVPSEGAESEPQS
jgi:hypothetical protein